MDEDKPFDVEHAGATGMIAIAIQQYGNKNLVLREWDHLDNYLLVEAAGKLYHVYVKKPDPKPDNPTELSG